MACPSGPPFDHAQGECDRVDAEDHERRGQAVTTPTDDGGEHDRAGEQPDASKPVDQVEAEAGVGPLGSDPASIELLQDTLEHPGASGYQIAERRCSQRDRHGCGEHDEHDIQVGENRRNGRADRCTLVGF